MWPKSRTQPVSHLPSLPQRSAPSLFFFFQQRCHAVSDEFTDAVPSLFSFAGCRRQNTAPPPPMSRRSRSCCCSPTVVFSRLHLSLRFQLRQPALGCYLHHSAAVFPSRCSSPQSATVSSRHWPSSVRSRCCPGSPSSRRGSPRPQAAAVRVARLVTEVRRSAPLYSLFSILVFRLLEYSFVWYRIVRK